MALSPEPKNREPYRLAPATTGEGLLVVQEPLARPAGEVLLADVEVTAPGTAGGALKPPAPLEGTWRFLDKGHLMDHGLPTFEAEGHPCGTSPLHGVPGAQSPELGKLKPRNIFNQIDHLALMPRLKELNPAESHHRPFQHAHGLLEGHKHLGLRRGVALARCEAHGGQLLCSVAAVDVDLGGRKDLHTGPGGAAGSVQEFHRAQKTPLATLTVFEKLTPQFKNSNRVRGGDSIRWGRVQDVRDLADLHVQPADYLVVTKKVVRDKSLQILGNQPTPPRRYFSQALA